MTVSSDAGQARQSKLPHNAFSLPKIAEATEPTKPPAGETPATVASSEAAPPVALTPAKGRKRAPASKERQDEEPLGLRLPEPIYERYLTYKEASGKTHTAILFDAIETTIDRLPGLVQERILRPEATTGLFDRPSTKIRAGEKVRTRAWVIRVSKTNKTIIENLTSELGAASSAQLTAIALEAYLSDK